MCGICGVAYSSRERTADRDVLVRMTESLHHRGPDSRGVHAAPGIGLGITRLSIIDLETGAQPISSEDGSVTLVCNGEIYNHQVLRERLIAAGHRFRTRSDVEVIVHLYEDHGVDCLHHLRGMFAFALWDSRQRRLMLARDRLGIKPLHYAIERDACYFGSEQKAILVADRVERALDVRALADLFTLGMVRTPKTFLTRIRRLPPGHYLLYQDGAASLHEYWDLDFTPDDAARMSPADWADALRERLVESVRLHLMSDVPVGAWLSPGLDSSTVAALMSRLVAGPIDTFTLGFEHPDFDETRANPTLDRFPDYRLTGHRVVCTAQDIALLPKAIWYSEDPVMGASDIPRMLLSQASATRVKVVLTGEGGDELFGGYGWFRVEQVLRPLARLPSALRALLAAVLARRHRRARRVYEGPVEMGYERYTRLVAPLNTGRGVLSAEVQEALTASGRRGHPDEDELRLPPGFRSWHPFEQLQYYDTKIRLPDRIELSLDRASMAYSLEARVPFLDHQLVEFCARIPPSLKMRWLRDKAILRRAMARLLPAEITRRRKQGLAAPFRHWLRQPLPDFAAELLSERQLRETSYFDPAAVHRLRADLIAGDDSCDRPLMAVLAVQLWDRLFIRDFPPPVSTRTS
jgi:asparagine synthase (glutamine-hydrolysing)